MTTAERAPSTWAIDPVHSRLDLPLEHMGFSTYRTGSRAVEGSLGFDPARPEASSVHASIPVATIDITNRARGWRSATRRTRRRAATSPSTAYSGPSSLDTHFFGQASIRSAGRSRPRFARRRRSIAATSGRAATPRWTPYLDQRAQTSLAAAGRGSRGSQARGPSCAQARDRGAERSQVAGIARTTARSSTLPMTQTGAAAGTGHDIEIEHGRRGRASSHPVPCPPVGSILRLSWIAFRNDVRARLYVCQLLLQALYLLLQLLHLSSQRDEER